jgi:hypothetical protein
MGEAMSEITYQPGHIKNLCETSIACGGGRKFVKQPGYSRCWEVRHEYMLAISARIQWQKEGWKYTKKYGWLCPKCAKVHTRLWNKKRKKK